jgi:hypothetical protein
VGAAVLLIIKIGYACTDRMYAEKNEEMSGESYVKTCREGWERVGRCVWGACMRIGAITYTYVATYA